MRIHHLSPWLRPTLILGVLLASPQFAAALEQANYGDEIAIRLPAVDGHVAKADLLARSWPHRRSQFESDPLASARRRHRLE